MFVSKASWRRFKDMPWRNFEDVFSVTIFRLPRRLKDVLRDYFKTYLQDVFETSSGRLEDISEDLNYYAKDMLKMSSRRRQDQQMFAGIVLWNLL